MKRFWHPETSQGFATKREASETLQVHPPALVEPTIEVRPATSPNQIAILNDTPTESGGEWSYGWTVTTVAATEAMVRAEAARRMRALVASYSDAERETWAVQEEEAKAVLADAEADAPLLSQLADADGITVAAMATKVMTNAGLFKAASGAILAAQRTLIAMDPIPSDFTDDSHWP